MSARLMTVPRLSGPERHKKLVRRKLPPLSPLREHSCTKESHAELRADYDRFVAETDLVAGGAQDFGDGTECVLRNCKLCGSSLMHEQDIRPRAVH